MSDKLSFHYILKNCYSLPKHVLTCNRVVLNHREKYILYLKTVSLQNETDTREAADKAKNSISLLLKNTFFVVTFLKKFLNVELCLLPSDIIWYFPTIYIFCNTFITQKDKHCWVILPIQQFSQFWYRILRLLNIS